MKLWGGRFREGTDRRAEEFLASIDFDRRLYRADILGSIAHARMLGRCGIISPEEAETLVRGLEELLADIEAGKVEFRQEHEDIHLNVEALLNERLGEVAKKLHTGRSRNDQVALDLRLYLREETDVVIEMLCKLQETLLALAEEHVETVMPGYTHLQRAQPVSLGHHFLAYFEMFGRDLERLRDCRRRIDVLPLGAGALAGPAYAVDRQGVAEELGFAAISENSLDAVSDRDFVVEFLAAASLIMMHLSRFCEELVLWSTEEFGFVELADPFTTGSSMMPQKKNPDVPELIRGKTGRVYGALVSVLTMLKALPLAYNKDLQEDKEPLFDAVDTVKSCLSIFPPLLSSMKIDRERLAQNAAGRYDLCLATDLADYLVTRGVPFRRAHQVVGRVVSYCLEQGRSLRELSLEEYRRFDPAFGEDLYPALDPRSALARRNAYGATAPVRVREALERARRRLAFWRQGKTS
ncbi:MAG: argininosuccinate lyase [Moorellales bacterium]